jgi:hypothetical protein
MSPKFLANQPQNEITLLKELATTGEKVPTTPKGGNHGHTNTITLQPTKKTSNTAESGRKTPGRSQTPQNEGWKPPSHHNQSKHHQTQQKQGWKTPTKSRELRAES